MSDEGTLEVLLIEDNPGDVRLIEAMLRDTHELAQRVSGRGESDRVRASARLHHENNLTDGLATLASTTDAVDIVLLDLNLPDSSGLETLTGFLEAYPDVPVVVLTGFEDRETGLEAINRGAQEYLVKADVTSPLLVRTLSHAIERHEQLREQRRRQAELEALNRLNRVGQALIRAVITTSSRAALEQAVCETLVETDLYLFAWIGDVRPGSDTVVARSAAGVEEGYLEEITITIDDSETAEGPTGKAFQTGRVHVARDIETDETYEPWRETARKRQYRSSAGVPLVYDEIRYGVLNVYASEPDRFGGYEREFLGRIGDIIAHAIASLERKDALLTDDALELEFRLAGQFPSLVEAVGDSERADGDDDRAIRFTQLIRSDETVLVYGAVAGVEQSTFEAAIEDEPLLEEPRILTPGHDEYEFEVLLSDPNGLFETVANHGARVEAMVIDTGGVRMLLELSQRTDTAQVIDTVETVCTNADYVAQRTVDRTGPTVPTRGTLEARLTDRQLESLKTAYHAGFFDWPRTSTGEEVADRLGISPATFTQHLRAAEQKFFDAVFESEESTEQATE